MEISLRNAFQDFNASKFVVYLALLAFTLMFALKMDGSMNVDWWFVFTPLWIWKTLALVGAFVGCVSHYRKPPTRSDTMAEVEFRGMMLCAGQHLLLVMFEVLACYKLSADAAATAPLRWTLIFVPLIFQCLVSIIICVWSVRQEKNFEFELFFSVNVIQFAFLSLKLDKFVDWSWAIVFIPLWILICLSLIGVLYAIILAVLLIRSIDLLPEHRRQHVYGAIGYTFLVVPLLVFLVLLTGKLDGPYLKDSQAAQVPYAVVFCPLYVSLACLMLMACGTKGGNTWWFGIRRDFCLFVLDVCPCLQEYGNVSYKFGRNGGDTDTSERRRHRQRNSRSNPAVSGVSEGGVEMTDAVVAGRTTAPRIGGDLRPVVGPTASLDLPD